MPVSEAQRTEARLTAAALREAGLIPSDIDKLSAARTAYKDALYSVQMRMDEARRELSEEQIERLLISLTPHERAYVTRKATKPMLTGREGDA